MTPQETKSLVEQIARRHVGKIMAWPNLHLPCAESNRCLAAHPDDPIEPGDDGWERFYADLTKELELEGDLPDALADETSELFSAAFVAEWNAQVKPCK